ncbi:MAG: SMP-30/gluconolactonase/LRE family protein, partial [Ferruginibacter sp.]
REGNIYLAGVGITVYNPQGVKLGNIPVPSKWVGNLCFGGRHRDLLLITASESVYTLQMAVKGEE